MSEKLSESPDTFEVFIERILPGGMGLAHAQGRTVFVALAAPGDRLRVRIERVKGTVAFASIQEIVQPSAVRIEPPCPYFGRCGGCDFQQMNYAAQLQAKVEIVRDCLRRIGGLQTIPEFSIIAAPNEWHYRSRAQWQFDSNARQLGYYESGSRRVCDVAECAVLVPDLQDTLSDLRAQMLSGSLREDARDFRAVIGDEGVSVSPGVGHPRTAESSGPDIRRSILGETYSLNAASFFQTNADLLPELINAALVNAEGDAAVELYCGVGLFTLPLARRCKQVLGVEGDPVAVGFARQNVATAGFKNVEIVQSDVGNWHYSSSRTPDFLLLDPPRTGAESRVIAGILKLKARRISYVSCDPPTLARDLKKLVAGGYSLDSIVAFDMFPQTHHVETVVQLRLRE